MLWSTACDAFEGLPPALSSPSKPSPDSISARSLPMRFANHGGARTMRWRWIQTRSDLAWARRCVAFIPSPPCPRCVFADVHAPGRPSSMQASSRHLLSATTASRSSLMRRRCAGGPCAACPQAQVQLHDRNYAALPSGTLRAHNVPPAVALGIHRLRVLITAGSWLLILTLPRPHARTRLNIQAQPYDPACTRDVRTGSSHPPTFLSFPPFPVPTLPPPSLSSLGPRLPCTTRHFPVVAQADRLTALCCERDVAVHMPESDIESRRAARLCRPPDLFPPHQFSLPGALCDHLPLTSLSSTIPSPSK
ncbi:hypothetical protein B0H14DRAFT_3876940 [Mycena olivaceomarginata]|nr:hypothetical protein B0H14DRAFT_3876940 [Mycena olivaceomarginata]